MSDTTNNDVQNQPDDLSINNLNDTTPLPSADPAQTQAAEGGDVPSKPASTPEPTVTPPTEPAQAAPVYVDAKQLAAEIAKQNQQPTAPTITQEQIDEVLKNFTIGDTEVENFLSPDTPLADKAKMLKLFIQRGVENAVARSNVIARSTMEKFYREEFVPVQSKISYDSAMSSRNAFYQEYPGFEPYADAVSLVAKSAMSNPEVAKMSPEKALSYVAEQTTALLRKTIPNFDPKVKVDNTATSPVNTGSAVPKATPSSFSSSTRVITTPSNGALPSSSSHDADVFGDEGLQ